jgi:aspartyl-tRNA(Asn)/glutamyl-tRNA(Gln) amidotransferase subunit C
LARLGLSGEELERMAGELSGILEHVDRIAELDLEGVEPTSHVVALENVLRADEPHESLPRDVALASAPDPVDGAFRVPSPQAE